jgi:hypothetical protein
LAPADSRHRQSTRAWPVGEDGHSLSHEMTLLCTSIRVFLGTEDPSTLSALLERVVAWDKLLDLARRHRTLPILSQALASIPPLLVPTYVTDGLRMDVQRITMHSLRQEAQLRDALVRLEAASIPAMPLKGPTLSRVLYGRSGIRQSSDLDLLVWERDLAPALRVFLTSGYTVAPSQSAPWRWSHLRRWGIHVHVCPPHPAQVGLELHWRLVPAYLGCDLDRDNLWGRASLCVLEGVAMRMATPEDLLLYLCVHGAKHQWQLLLGLCDIAALIQRTPEFSWHWLVQHAEQIGATRRVVLSLLLVEALLGVELPATLHPWLAHDPKAMQLARSIRRRLLTAETDRVCLENQYVWWWKSMTRTRDRARFGLWWIVNIVTPQLTDLGAFPLPERLAGLYWLLRPVRLSWKCVFMAMRTGRSATMDVRRWKVRQRK